MRKLPVYLLIDASGSMAGEPIEAVKNGIQMLVAALRQDPYALETAYLSVITFSQTAEQAVPLTELSLFQPPQIEARGTTALGAALSLLSNRIDVEVKKTTMEVKGDWKPMVFIMTDGIPTDVWWDGLEEYKKRKVAITVACAAGNKADSTMLKKITDVVVELETADSSSIAAFFKWVSASISTGSQKVETGGGDDIGGLDELPPPPPELNVVI